MNLQETYRSFLEELQRSVHQREHGFRIIQFGTISSQGPQIRSVVLRRIETEPLRLYFHTHIDSPKVIEINNHNKTAVHAYCNSCKKQMRFSGTSRVLTTGDIYEEQLLKISASASRCYLTSFAPTTRLDEYHPNIPEMYLDEAPSSVEKDKLYEKMVVVEFTPTEVDALWLRATGHVRLHGTLDGLNMHLSWLAP